MQKSEGERKPAKELWASYTETISPHASSSRSDDERQEWLVLSLLSIRWCHECSVLFGSQRMVTSSRHRTTTRNGSNSKKDWYLHPHKRLGAHHHYCPGVVSAVTKRRHPQKKAHARLQLIGACKPCRLHSGREDNIAQDWRSIPTRDLSRLLLKTASLVVEKASPGIRWFTCPGSEMAFTGLAFDPNHD